jgi:hypothetical protein
MTRRSIIRGILLTGVVAAVLLQSGTPARADVIRTALNTVEAADFDAQAALMPKFVAMLKSGAGNKAAYAVADKAELTVGTVSIWGAESEAAKVTDSAEWKDHMKQLKPVTREVRFLELQ